MSATPTRRLPVAERDEARQALRGIAVYAAWAREQLRSRPAAQIADDVLRHIEQHALEVLDGCHAPQPALLPAAVTGRERPARWPRPLSAQAAADVLRDPPTEMLRVPVVDVLSVVPELGPHGARRLLRRHHIAHRTWLGARSWARLADDVLQGGVPT